MRIGFTGTQKGMTARQIDAAAAVLSGFYMLSSGPVEVHHGDCIGADEMFHVLARGVSPDLRPIRIVLHPPIIGSKRAYCRADEERTPRPYIARNHAIVDGTDFLIATPSGPEEVRSGTWATIRYADKKGRPVRIVWPDGSVSGYQSPPRTPRGTP